MFDGVARRERGELTLRQAMGIHELDVQLECLGSSAACIGVVLRQQPATTLRARA
jgi:hypothetical protein